MIFKYIIESEMSLREVDFYIDLFNFMCVLLYDVTAEKQQLFF